MMVTFISQCEKNALKKTRRVLDAFANRIGDNTWQTVITRRRPQYRQKNAAANRQQKHRRFLPLDQKPIQKPVFMGGGQ